MLTFKSIRDHEGYGAKAAETRRKIIFLLRAKDMTVSQLAEVLRKTPQAIYHQLSILQKVGMVEEAREVRVKNFIETYYRATAEVFLFQEGEVPMAESEKMWSEALAALAKVGVHVRQDEEFVRKIAKANTTIAHCGPPDDLEEKLAKLDESTLLTNSRARDLAQLALMTERQFDEFMGSWRELRKRMVSGVSRRGTEQ